jgi:predicted SAM-dependent methyltransferase
MMQPHFDRVQLGCGPGPLAPGWAHVDGSWNARLSKYPRVQRLAARLAGRVAEGAEHVWSRQVVIHDVRKPLPFKDQSVCAVYSSHLLEHLYIPDAERLLGECHRILRAKGVLRVVVPDLREMVSRYVAGDPETSGDELMRALHVRPVQSPPANPIVRAYTSLFDFHSHKWMYDAASLARRLAQAGFHDVRERACHDSAIQGIEKVERPDRVTNHRGVCLEGVKE